MKKYSAIGTNNTSSYFKTNGSHHNNTKTTIWLHFRSPTNNKQHLRHHTNRIPRKRHANTHQSTNHYKNLSHHRMPKNSNRSNTRRMEHSPSPQPHTTQDTTIPIQPHSTTDIERLHQILIKETCYLMQIHKFYIRNTMRQNPDRNTHCVQLLLTSETILDSIRKWTTAPETPKHQLVATVFDLIKELTNYAIELRYIRNKIINFQDELRTQTLPDHSSQ